MCDLSLPMRWTVQTNPVTCCGLTEEDDVSDSLVVKQARANMFDLTPVWAPVEPPAKRAKTAEVRLSSASDVPMTQSSSDEEDSDSSGSNSDVSSQDDSSDVSDLDKFEEAYTDFGALTARVDPRTLERDCSGHPNEEVPGLDLPGGVEALHSRQCSQILAAGKVDYSTKCSQQAAST